MSANDITLVSKSLSKEDKSFSLENSKLVAKNKLKITVQEDLIIDKSDIFNESYDLELNVKSLDNRSNISNISNISTNNNITINSQESIINSQYISAPNKVELIAKGDIRNNIELNSNTAHGIKGKTTYLSSLASIINKNFLTSKETMTLEAIEVINYAAIASFNNINGDSNLSIKVNNLTNYNLILSDDNINFYIKDHLLNETNNTKVSGVDFARIQAHDNIFITGAKNNSLRINKITNDKAIIETKNEDINIYANEFYNNLDTAISMSETRTEDFTIDLKKVRRPTHPKWKWAFYDETEEIMVGTKRLTSHFVWDAYAKRLKKMQDKGETYAGPYNSLFADTYTGFYLISPQIGSIGRYNYNGRKSISIGPWNQPSSVIGKRYTMTRALTNGTNNITKAQLISGKNIILDISSKLQNNMSNIIAKNDISIKGGNLELKNKSVKIGKVQYLEKFYNGISQGILEIHDESTDLNSTIQAGGSITAEANKLDNVSGLKPGEVANKPFLITAVSTNTKNKVDNQDEELDKLETIEDITIPTNKYGLFISSTNPAHEYLIEANPTFTNINNFLEKLNFRADKIVKRLGDASYETQLVKRSIINQTGKQVLGHTYMTANEQFIKLMDNAVNVAGILKLEVGKKPTSTQLANLRKNIVWMEYRLVQGQKVLVPIVYLAKDYVKASGATILANNINFKIKNDVLNTGTLSANNNLDIKAKNIVNNKGNILAKASLSLEAKNDISNIGASIKGGSVKLNTIEGSVTNKRLIKTTFLGNKRANTVRTQIGSKAIIEASNGNLTIEAKKDINNIAGTLRATKNISLNSKEGNVNFKTLKILNEDNYISTGYTSKTKDINYLQASASAGKSLIINAGKNINLEASIIKAKDTLSLKAKEDINITAVNTLKYTDYQSSKKKSWGRSEFKREMSYKESVLSSTLNAKNIQLISGNDINLEATIIKAKEKKIAYAKNNLNIFSKSYKEASLKHTKTSSFGGLIKNEHKLEKDYLKIKSSELTADNIILNAKEINIQASNIRANTASITADVMNLFSSKERLFENEFSNNGGIITATIETKGKIQELVIPSTITVNDKLVFNNKDITSQLETNELLKTLSSQSDLSLEQINLIKEIANNDNWHTTTTTLSGLGSLIVQALVTFVTSGAGAYIVTGLSQTVTQAAVQTATQVAVKAAVQAIVVQATSSLLTSVITGNKFKLDIKSLAKSAITAGVLSYASGLEQLKLNDLNLGEITQEFAQKAIDTSIKTGVQSAVYGTDFKDSLGTNLVMAGTDLIAKTAFKKVGTTSMKKGEVEQNDSYKDGGLAKTAIHSLTGGAIAAIKGENVLAGALSAGAREAISPLTKDSSNKTQLLVSQLTGITVGALVNGEDGAKTGMSIANSGELYNRQLHQDEIRFINNNSKDFASKLVSINLVGKQYTISDKQARKILFEALKYMIDNNSKEKSIDRLKYVVVQGVSRKDLIAGIRYLEQNSKGLSIIDTYKQSMKPQAYFTSTSTQFKDSS